MLSALDAPGLSQDQSYQQPSSPLSQERHSSHINPLEPSFTHVHPTDLKDIELLRKAEADLKLQVHQIENTMRIELQLKNSAIASLRTKTDPAQRQEAQKQIE
ncbi:hypothetical protein HDV05_001993, partial [Chytridiales sp. JEL 0842]